MCGIIIVGHGVAQVIISIQEVLNMKLYDKNTGVVIADIITNHGMTIVYLRAASVLREVSNAPAVDLSPAEQFLQLTEGNREKVKEYVAQLLQRQDGLEVT